MEETNYSLLRKITDIQLQQFYEAYNRVTKQSCVAHKFYYDSIKSDSRLYDFF